MTKLEKEAEEKYCKGCKWRIEQCLWAWRKTNGLKEPNEKNCSCKEVPAYLAGAEPREKRIAELEAQIEKMKCCNNCKHRCFMDWKSVCGFDLSEIKDIENPVTCKCNKWEIKEK